MLKGKTVPCSSCKKILFRYLNASGEVSFDMICPSCKEMVCVQVKLEPVITIVRVAKKLLIFLFLAGLAYSMMVIFKVAQVPVAQAPDYMLEFK